MPRVSVLLRFHLTCQVFQSSSDFNLRQVYKLLYYAEEFLLEVIYIFRLIKPTFEFNKPVVY